MTREWNNLFFTKMDVQQKNGIKFFYSALSLNIAEDRQAAGYLIGKKRH
jgi:hypothetical protein